MPKPKEKFEYCYLTIIDNTNKGEQKVYLSNGTTERDLSKDYEKGHTLPLLMQVLNDLGAEGWEYFNLHQHIKYAGTYFLKRKVQG